MPSANEINNAISDELFALVARFIEAAPQPRQPYFSMNVVEANLQVDAATAAQVIGAMGLLNLIIPSYVQLGTGETLTWGIVADVDVRWASIKSARAERDASLTDQELKELEDRADGIARHLIKRLIAEVRRWREDAADRAADAWDRDRD